MALRLVERGFTRGAMFNPDGEVVHPADLLYGRPVLVERSRFKPPTLFNMNMLDCAQTSFSCDIEVAENDVVILSEMTLKNLKDGDDINTGDFLQRADILCALGKHVLVSNMGEYYRLANYLLRCTRKPTAIVMGILSMRDIFNEAYYEDLAGGILEAFGRLFKYDLRLYVAPRLEPDGSLLSLESFQPDEHLRHLFLYLLENRFINPLNSVNRDYLGIFSDQVLQEIKQRQPGWEEKVPQLVCDLIHGKHLFE
jgi:hypothetical protein